MKKITAEVLNIGDEILIGQILNTNAQWIARQFNEIGIPLARITTIGDHKEAILQGVEDALSHHDIVIVTGGLGPTKDDITKDALCTFFQTPLVLVPEILEGLETFFRARGREVNDANRSQAYMPENCTPLINHWGTAAGMLFEKDGKVLVSLPGVPFEMQKLMEGYVIPLLKERLNFSPLVHRSFITQGIPESDLMGTIGDWENNLPEGLRLAYLPSSGEVKLRLSSMNLDGKAEEVIAEQAAKLYAILGNEIYGEGETNLETLICELLIARNQTIATAESCTGGYIAHKLTTVPGISAVYMGSVVAYDNQIKKNLLRVPEALIEAHGAVSGPVVEYMATEVRRLMHTDYSIAVSGIAGPGGGTEEKPVGTVWIAWATPQKVYAKKYLFANDRMGNIHRTYQYALNYLRKLIQNGDH